VDRRLEVARILSPRRKFLGTTVALVFALWLIVAMAFAFSTYLLVFGLGLCIAAGAYTWSIRCPVCGGHPYRAPPILPPGAFRVHCPDCGQDLTLPT
jgi:rRNA maturation protein Nop10